MICEVKSTIFPKWDDSSSNGCVVDFCKNVMDIARNETCGKCVFCREGTRQVYEILKDVTEGKAVSEDFELLLDLLEQIKNASSCEIAKQSSSMCIDLMKNHEEEWDKHIRRKRCLKLVCKGCIPVGSVGNAPGEQAGAKPRRKRRKK